MITKAQISLVTKISLEIVKIEKILDFRLLLGRLYMCFDPTASEKSEEKKGHDLLLLSPCVLVMLWM